MSQIHHATCTLEDMIRQSDLIVVVNKTQPFRRIRNKRISLLPWKKPFPTIFHCYQVEEILFQKSTSNLIQPATHIAVRMAHFHQKLVVHKKYYNSGLRKSPIYSQYDGEMDPADADRMIIFCRREATDGILQYVIENAFEAEGNRREIEKIVAE